LGCLQIVTFQLAVIFIVLSDL